MCRGLCLWLRVCRGLCQLLRLLLDRNTRHFSNVAGVSHGLSSSGLPVLGIHIHIDNIRMKQIRNLLQTLGEILLALDEWRRVQWWQFGHLGVLALQRLHEHFDFLLLAGIVRLQRLVFALQASYACLCVSSTILVPSHRSCRPKAPLSLRNSPSFPPSPAPIVFCPFRSAAIRVVDTS